MHLQLGKSRCTASYCMLNYRLQMQPLILLYFVVTCSWARTLHVNPKLTQLRNIFSQVTKESQMDSGSFTAIAWSFVIYLTSNKADEVKISWELSSLTPSVFSTAPFQIHRELKVALIILVLLNLLKLRLI